MTTIVITQVLTNWCSPREQDVANQLIAAAVNRDTEKVQRMLTRNRTVRSLRTRGVIKVEEHPDV